MEKKTTLLTDTYKLKIIEKEHGTKRKKTILGLSIIISIKLHLFLGLKNRLFSSTIIYGSLTYT